MSTKTFKFFMIVAVIAMFVSCKHSEKENSDNEAKMQTLLNNYAEVELKVDLSHLTNNQKEMIAKLMEVADIMDELFWLDVIEKKSDLLAKIDGKNAKKYVEINYGPWDRLDGNNPFIEGYGEKPQGVNYYPKDITEEEFDNFTDENKNSWYTVLRRDEDGSLKCVWYHELYSEQIEKAAKLLEEAAELAEDDGFKNYLKLRAKALRTDDYFESDLAWMDMKTNLIDFVVGPIESYEDDFKGLKASHSGQILLKDMEWSKNIERFNKTLPQLQASLPVPAEYKPEVKEDEENTTGDMNVYYAVYYGGDCNSGSKNIAINLPNDPNVHEAKGSRKLQLKNSMQAKFDKILIPIANLLIDDSQLKHIKFEDAFFQNVMFHEVAHGLGVKFTIENKEKSVRDALEECYSAIEEAKADIAGLYMITQLYEMGEFAEKDLMDNYVTFIAGIFRSVRFGAASSHGKANMLEFNYLQEKNAFTKNETTGKYSVNFEIMKEAISELLREIITIQGDGNKALAKEWIETKSIIMPELEKDLKVIEEANIPKDIVFKQGKEILGL